VASRPLPLLRGGATTADAAPVLVTAAALTLAVVVATLMVVELKYGAALFAAVCVGPVALLRPPLAIAFWVAILFFSRVSGAGAVVDYFLFAIVACWLGLLAGRRADARQMLARNQAALVPVALFVVWVAMTLAWSPAPDVARDALQDLVYATLAFGLMLGAISDRRHVRWLAAAFVAGAALSVLWGAAKGGLSGAIGGPGAVTDHDGRFQAGSGDPNYLAAVLVPAIMLAGGLAFRRSILQRTWLALAVVAIAVGLAATQSRGGIVAALVTSVVALVIWRRRRAMILGLIVVATAALATFFALSPAAWQRISAGNETGSGRIDIWSVAWRVVSDHPFEGVGFNQFPEVSPHYVLQPGALDYVDLIVDKHIVVHNLFLELWVETGIVGLLLFLAIIALSIAAAWRAVALFDRLGDEEMAALSRTLLLALVGMFSASLFLSNVANRQIWVLLALGPVLAGIARHDAQAAARLAGERLVQAAG
jgi:O-antigen ligase